MRNMLRNSLAIGMLLILTTMSGPANASPLQSVTASAYGLKATGLLNTTLVQVSSSFPPAATNERTDLLQLPLTPLAFSGTATVRAITRTDSELDSSVPSNRLSVQSGSGPVPSKYNARGYSRTEGLALLATTGIDLPGTLNDVISNATLLSLGAVESEALIACVAGAPTVVAGSRLIGPLKLLGLDLEVPVDNLVNQVVEVTGALRGLLELRRNVINKLPNGGVEVIGLQIRVLSADTGLAGGLGGGLLGGVGGTSGGGGLVVNVAQSQINGSGACVPVKQCSDTIDNDGDGKIDFVAPAGAERDPDCTSAEDDSEAGVLARTGGGNPGLGAALLALGGLMLITTRRLRKSGL